jgi:hypothetical protein
MNLRKPASMGNALCQQDGESLAGDSDQARGRQSESGQLDAGILFFLPGK